MCTVGDFKSEIEWKCQYDDKTDKLCMKRDDNENDEHEFEKSNLRLKVHKHSFTKHQLSEHCCGMLGVLEKRPAGGRE